MKRRELFPLFAGMAWAAPDAPRFFTPAQYETLTALADTILPREPNCPGAVDVHVPWFIDTLLFYNQQAPRQAWTQGLAALESGALSRFQKSFSALTAEQRRQLLEPLAENETRAQQPLERFFVLAKRAIVEAWALSEDGMRRGLGYQGNTAVREFRAED